MAKKWIWLLAGLACAMLQVVSAAASVPVEVVPRPAFPQEAISLSSGWEYLFVPVGPDGPRSIDFPPAAPPAGSSGWRSIRSIDPSKFTLDVEYWVRIRLPEIIPEPGGLYTSGWSPAIAWYLSDSLIATHKNAGPEPDNIYRAPEWYVVQLPAGSAGSMLYIWRPKQEPLLELERSIIAPVSNTTRWKWIAPLENFILRSIQRGDLGYLALGMIFLSIGLVTLALFLTRQENRYAALLFFSAMSLFFGSRYLVNTPTFRFWAAGSDQFWNTAGTIFGYLSGIAAFNFFRCFLGPGRRSSITWSAVAYTLYACIAIVLILLLTTPSYVPEIANILVITCIAILITNLLLPEMRRMISYRSLLAALILGGFFIILDNLRGLGFSLLQFNMEWLGILIIYITLGGLTTHRYFSREQKLVAIRQELDTARRIQMSILPQAAPSSPRLAIASRYVPMTDVAGDFYDFLSVGEAGFGALVADVSGHGVSAALIASMIKVAFHAQEEYADDPARVLAGINQSLSGQLGEQFVTAGYAFIDTGSGSLRYAGAAHPPLLIRRAGGGTIDRIDENGLMIGPFPDASYTAATRRVEPGDTLLLYTDGIVEAMNGQEEEYGEKRLRRFLAGNNTLPVEQLLDTLLTDVTAWCCAGNDGTAGDDLTVIAIEITDGQTGGTADNLPTNRNTSLT